VLYGRSDKQYCTDTCRRNACRVRDRTVRLGSYEFQGREVRDTELEAILIPKLIREVGPNHKSVQQARRRAEERREAERKALLAQIGPLLDRMEASPSD